MKTPEQKLEEFYVQKNRLETVLDLYDKCEYKDHLDMNQFLKLVRHYINKIKSYIKRWHEGDILIIEYVNTKLRYHNYFTTKLNEYCDRKITTYTQDFEKYRTKVKSKRVILCNGIAKGSKFTLETSFILTVKQILENRFTIRV